MSVSLVALNHSSHFEYWASCINQIGLGSEINYSEINLLELWEVNSSFNWDEEIHSIIDEQKTETLIILAYGCGAFLLQKWLKNNQHFVSKLKVHAILIDSPPLSSWQNDNPLEDLIKMDRSTYKNKVLETLAEQSAPKEWIQSITSNTNYLKSLLIEIHQKTQTINDDEPLVPLLEEWHEIRSMSLPTSSANILKKQRKSLPTWHTIELLGPNLPLFPIPNLTPHIQRIITDILYRSK